MFDDVCMGVPLAIFWEKQQGDSWVTVGCEQDDMGDGGDDNRVMG